MPTAGKKVPGSPDWLNKSVVTRQLRRLRGAGRSATISAGGSSTYTNDLAVDPVFHREPAPRLDAARPASAITVHALTVALNVTNVTDKTAQSTLTIGAASDTYNAFPLAPRQYFGTVSFGF